MDGLPNFPLIPGSSSKVIDSGVVAVTNMMSASNLPSPEAYDLYGDGFTVQLPSAWKFFQMHVVAWNNTMQVHHAAAFEAFAFRDQRRVTAWPSYSLSSGSGFNLEVDLAHNDPNTIVFSGTFGYNGQWYSPTTAIY